MFLRNEKVVYPGHGVAHINRIIEKKIAGNTVNFLELTFLNKDMTILVPVSNAQEVGMRPLSSAKHVNDLFEILARSDDGESSIELITTNWNKRNKEYQGKLRTGSLCGICEIYRDLRKLGIYKELSFGEKALLAQTESLLVEEIALVKNMAEDKVIERLRSLVGVVDLPNKILVEKNI